MLVTMLIFKKLKFHYILVTAFHIAQKFCKVMIHSTVQYAFFTFTIYFFVYIPCQFTSMLVPLCLCRVLFMNTQRLWKIQMKFTSLFWQPYYTDGIFLERNFQILPNILLCQLLELMNDLCSHLMFHLVLLSSLIYLFLFCCCLS